MSQSPVSSPPAAEASNDPDEYRAWRESRWDEVAGPNGRATVVVVGELVGRGTQTLPGVPGQWTITESGALTVTAGRWCR